MLVNSRCFPDEVIFNTHLADVCVLSGQCHNYISDVYNKPNRLKFGRKLSKLWLFKKCMHHLNNVMTERADCGKMAASADATSHDPSEITLM